MQQSALPIIIINDDQDLSKFSNWNMDIGGTISSKGPCPTQKFIAKDCALISPTDFMKDDFF